MVQPPPVVNGVTLRRKADLGCELSFPEISRGLQCWLADHIADVLVAALSFKGDFFNAVQSKVFDVVSTAHT